QRAPLFTLFPYTTLFRSPVAGTVKALNVKVGDKVSQGSLILTVTTGVTGAAPATPPRAAALAPPVAAPAAAAAYAGSVDIECERSEEHTSELQSRFDLVC